MDRKELTVMSEETRIKTDDIIVTEGIKRGFPSGGNFWALALSFTSERKSSQSRAALGSGNPPNE